MNFGLEHVRHIHHRAERAEHAHRRLKEHVENTTGEVIETLEMAFGAALGGLLQGHAGPTGGKVAGIPMDLLAGLGLTAAGLFDLAGKHSEHLLSIGKGLVAAYVADTTFDLGVQWRAKGSLGAALKAGPATTTSGALAPGRVPSATDLAALTAAMSTAA